MAIDTSTLRSKVGRRIFGLFVLCAIIPIAALALISFWNVNSQLQAQNRRDLRQVSHEYGMIVFERLNFVETNLKLLASRPLLSTSADAKPASFPVNLSRTFRGIELRSQSGRHSMLFGRLSSEFDIASDELPHLDSGKTVISTRSCGGIRACVFAIQELPAAGPDKNFIIAEIAPPFLLETETVPQGKDICVLDSDGRMLVCSGQAPASLPATISTNVSGQFEWIQSGRTYQSDYWNVFLKPVFLTEHWTIVASEARDDVFSPLERFKEIFLSVIVLAFLVVLLLSIIQIRRNLVPLGRLQEGTRAIARGDFLARVYVRGEDEFRDLAESFNSMAGQLEKQFDVLTVKSTIDRAVLSAWNIDQIIGTLFNRLHKLLPYQLATVTLVDPEHLKQATQYLSWGTGGKHENRTIALTDADLQQLTTGSEIELAISDAYYPQFLAALASRNMRYFLVAPILLNEKISAFISLGQTEQANWSDDDKALLRQIADQVGVALSNARLVSDLKELSWGTLTALARTIDAKSPWTSGHSERVTAMALKIAREMDMAPKDIDIIHRGGLLHDIGKIGIPPEILDKAGKLDPAEMATMQSHVVIGARILEPITSFRECLPVVLQHHEWINGNGYPYGLKGEGISLHARIFAVADCYDALISDRPYRAGLALSKVLDILGTGVGKQFDPQVMDAFLRVIEREKGPMSPAAVTPVAAV